VLTDRIDAVEIKSRHRFIDDGNGRYICRVALGKGAAMLQRDLQNTKIIRRDPAEVSGLHFPRLRLRLTFDLKSIDFLISTQRQRIAGGSGLYAGEIFNAPNDLCKERGCFGTIAIGIVGQRDVKSENAFGIKARAHVRELRETLDQEARRNQKHERECDLGDDQAAAQPMMTRGRAPIAFFQFLTQANARRLKSGRETEEQSGRD